MNPFADPSLRRYILALAGLIATAGNKYLKLDLSPEQVTELLIFLGGVIAISNTKEVMLAKAAASGQAAAATVTTPADAAVVLAAPEAKP